MTKEKVQEAFRKIYHKDPTDLEYFQFRKWYEAEKRIRWWSKSKKEQGE